MKELQQIVNDKITSMVEAGDIQKKIEDCISKSIDGALENQFRAYGHIAKQIDKALEKGLAIDFNEVPFETYNEQMLVILKQKLGSFFKDVASEKFISEIDRVLEPAPKEMPINEFVEKVIELWKTDEPHYADDLDEYATVEIKPYDNAKSPNDMSLQFWKKKESGYGNSNRPTMELFILNGKIRINHQHIYNPTCFSETEALVFKMYAAGTILTDIEGFNPDDCDLTLKDYDY